MKVVETFPDGEVEVHENIEAAEIENEKKLLRLWQDGADFSIPLVGPNIEIKD